MQILGTLNQAFSMNYINQRNQSFNRVNQFYIKLVVLMCGKRVLGEYFRYLLKTTGRNFLWFLIKQINSHEFAISEAREKPQREILTVWKVHVWSFLINFHSAIFSSGQFHLKNLLKCRNGNNMVVFVLLILLFRGKNLNLEKQIPDLWEI